MNFILKLAKVTDKKRPIYMHLLLLFIVLCGLPGPRGGWKEVEITCKNSYKCAESPLFLCLVSSLVLHKISRARDSSKRSRGSPICQTPVQSRKRSFISVDLLLWLGEILVEILNHKQVQ